MSVSKNGNVTVSATRQKAGQKPLIDTYSGTIPPLEADGPLSEVEVSIGQTVNLGNYNSLRVDVHVRIPVNRGAEEEGIKYAESVADAHAERIINANKF